MQTSSIRTMWAAAMRLLRRLGIMEESVIVLWRQDGSAVAIHADYVELRTPSIAVPTKWWMRPGQDYIDLVSDGGVAAGEPTCLSSYSSVRRARRALQEIAVGLMNGRKIKRGGVSWVGAVALTLIALIVLAMFGGNPPTPTSAVAAPTVAPLQPVDVSSLMATMPPEPVIAESRMVPECSDDEPAKRRAP